jgi:ATP-binding cassette subfamily B protein
MHAPSVAWMPMLPMPFILGGSIAFQKLLAPRYPDVRQKVGLLNGRLSNNLSSITTIKSFTDKDYETVRLEAGSNGCYRINTKIIALHAAFIPLIRILILAAFTVLLILGGMEGSSCGAISCRCSEFVGVFSSTFTLILN